MHEHPWPKTAEDLMRSRFAAVRDADRAQWPVRNLLASMGRYNDELGVRARLVAKTRSPPVISR